MKSNRKSTTLIQKSFTDTEEKYVLHLTLKIIAETPKILILPCIPGCVKEARETIGTQDISVGLAKYNMRPKKDLL